MASGAALRSYALFRVHHRQLYTPQKMTGPLLEDSTASLTWRSASVQFLAMVILIPRHYDLGREGNSILCSIFISPNSLGVFCNMGTINKLDHKTRSPCFFQEAFEWKSVVLQELKQLESMVGLILSLRCKLGGSLFWEGLHSTVSPGVIIETADKMFWKSWDLTYNRICQGHSKTIWQHGGLQAREYWFLLLRAVRYLQLHQQSCVCFHGLAASSQRPLGHKDFCTHDDVTLSALM